MTRSKRPAHQTGWSLVDAAIVLAVVSLIVTHTQPAFKRFQDEQTIKSMASLIRTDLQFARSSAVATGQPVRLQVLPDATKVCYVVRRGPATSCTCNAPTGPVCDGGVLMASTAIDTKGGIRLSTSSRNLNFDGTIGTVTPTATFTLADRTGNALKLVVNVMGRVRTCVASGHVSGYPAC